MRIIDECRETSMSIIDEYKELKNVVINYGEDSTQFKEKLREILEMVIVEYRLYQGVKYPRYQIEQEKNKPEKYRNSFGIDLLTYQARVLLKLETADAMLEGNYLYINELFPNLLSVPGDIKLAIHDVMCSCLEIEALKRINIQMQDVSNITILDEKFICGVLSEHLETKIHYLTSRFTSELLALCHGFDFAKIPEFNYTMFIDAINKKYGVTSGEISKSFDEGLKQMVLHTLKILLSVEDVCANAETYYEYILYSGFIDVYISYMSYEKKKELSQELKKLVIKDSLVRKKIRSLLLRKKEE